MHLSLDELSAKELDQIINAFAITVANSDNEAARFSLTAASQSAKPEDKRRGLQEALDCLSIRVNRLLRNSDGTFEFRFSRW